MGLFFSHVLHDVLTVSFNKMLAVLLLLDEDCGMHCIDMLESLVLCELRACYGIGEMGEAVFDILVIGYGTGAKAYISIRKP